MPSTELTEVLLPSVAKGDLELEAIQEAAALGWGEASVGPRQQGGEDGAKVLVDLEEGDKNAG